MFKKCKRGYSGEDIVSLLEHTTGKLEERLDAWVSHNSTIFRSLSRRVDDVETTSRWGILDQYRSYERSLDEKNNEIKIAHFDSGKGTKPKLLVPSFEGFMDWIKCEKRNEPNF